MQTNFFSQWAQLDVKQVTISLFFDQNGILAVSVLPKSNSKDKAAQLIPIMLTAKPEELDLEFFDKIKNPMQRSSQHLDNIEKYEALLAVKSKETQAENDKKKLVKEQEDKLKKVVDASDFDPHKAKAEVLKICAKLIELEPLNSLAKKWRTEIQVKTSTVSLFDSPIEEPQDCQDDTCPLEDDEDQNQDND